LSYAPAIIPERVRSRQRNLRKEFRPVKEK